MHIPINNYYLCRSGYSQTMCMGKYMSTEPWITLSKGVAKVGQRGASAPPRCSQMQSKRKPLVYAVERSFLYLVSKNRLNGLAMIN